MTFLVPLALFGFALLSLPVLVHLFKPRSMKPAPFSSLRWLKRAQQRVSRRIEWHQWLLFLTRAGIIAAFVLALAKPILNFATTGAAVDRILVIDGCRWMTAISPEGITPLEQAKAFAQHWLDAASPHDRSAVIVADGLPRVIVPLSQNPGSARANVAAITAGAADPNITDALAIVPTLLGSATNRVELVFVTANQKTGWRPVDIAPLVERLGDRLAVRVVDLAPAITSNAWIASARFMVNVAGDEAIVRVDVGFAGDGAVERTVRLRAGDGLDEKQVITVAPGKIGRALFRVPNPSGFKNQVATLELSPADALPDDDRYFLPLDASWATNVVIVEEAEGTGALYVRSALESLSSAIPGSLRITSRAAKTLTAGDLRDADVTILAGLPNVPDETILALERRVREGMGLIAFLGPMGDEAPASTGWHKPMRDGVSLLPQVLKNQMVNASQSPVMLAEVRWSHRLLAPLADPRLSDLGTSKFSRFVRLPAPASLKADILARFEDGTPALLDQAWGAGRILVLNTSATDAWSDLPRARSFVPFVDQMVNYVTGGQRSDGFVVGSPIIAPLPDGVTSARVTTPSGKESPARIVANGGRRRLTIDDIREPGVWTLTDSDHPERTWPMAVNIGRGALGPAPMDGEMLKAMWRPTPISFASNDTATSALLAQTSGWPLWSMCVFLGGLLLIVETLAVAWLCPRRNPTLAAGVVSGRGLLKPLDAGSVR